MGRAHGQPGAIVATGFDKTFGVHRGRGEHSVERPATIVMPADHPYIVDDDDMWEPAPAGLLLTPPQGSVLELDLAAPELEADLTEDSAWEEADIQLFRAWRDAWQQQGITRVPVIVTSTAGNHLVRPNHRTTYLAVEDDDAISVDLPNADGSSQPWQFGANVFDLTPISGQQYRVRMDALPVPLEPDTEVYEIDGVNAQLHITPKLIDELEAVFEETYVDATDEDAVEEDAVNRKLVADLKAALLDGREFVPAQVSLLRTADWRRVRGEDETNHLVCTGDAPVEVICAVATGVPVVNSVGPDYFFVAAADLNWKPVRWTTEIGGVALEEE